MISSELVPFKNKFVNIIIIYFWLLIKFLKKKEEF